MTKAKKTAGDEPPPYNKRSTDKMSVLLFTCLAYKIMKIAHLRASEHFTFAKQIFYREKISLAQKSKFRLAIY